MTDLVLESHFPDNEPEGLIVSFYPKIMNRARASDEFKNFAFVVLCDPRDQYYRIENGHYRNPMKYVDALKAFAIQHEIHEKDIMAFGTSRMATMALFVGWSLGIRAVLACGAQPDALADIGYIQAFGVGPGIGWYRILHELEWLDAIYRSIKDGVMTIGEFHEALESLDLRHVLMRSKADFPRTYIFLGKENREDNYPMPGLIEAARAKKAHLDIRRFPGYEHAVLGSYKDEYILWMRSIWDNKSFETPGERELVHGNNGED